jgi:hypothetical protein
MANAMLALLVWGDRGRRVERGIVTVWLLTEDCGNEHEHLGLYSSQDAARKALSALVPDAAIDWWEGGTDSVTFASVRAGDRAVRAFQVYPLELDPDPAADDPAGRATHGPGHARRDAPARRGGAIAEAAR